VHSNSSPNSAFRLLYASLLVVATGLVVPLFLRTYLRPFDPTPLDTITREKPEYVFIGNSMVWSRIDPSAFREAGTSAYYYVQDPTYVPSWYLGLKNYVAASPHRPKKVFLFFRDDELTHLSWNFSPGLLQQMEAYRHFQEPVFDRLVYSKESKSLFGESIARIARFYREVRNPIALASDDWLKLILPQVSMQRHATNSFLHSAGRRPASAGEVRADTVQRTDGSFGALVERSWLPHFIEIAKRDKVPLCFFRVKRSPVERARTPTSFSNYLRDLREYFQANQICFHDENEFPEITDDFYIAPADDHIAKDQQKRYSRWFISRFCEVSPKH
jgi:hypothetical protein